MNDKTFTQEEVNKIIQDRLERERARYNTDADNLSQLREQLAKVTTELEETKADVAEKERIKLEKELENKLIECLTANNIVAPDTIKGLFQSKVTINDNKELLIDGNNANEHIKQWGKVNPWAIKTIQKPGSGYTGNSTTYNTADDEYQALKKAFFKG